MQQHRLAARAWSDLPELGPGEHLKQQTAPTPGLPKKTPVGGDDQGKMGWMRLLEAAGAAVVLPLGVNDGN
jgi:hypothetical protein